MKSWTAEVVFCVVALFLTVAFAIIVYEGRTDELGISPKPVSATAKAPTTSQTPVGPKTEAIIKKVVADKKDQLENIPPETAKKLEELGFSTKVHKIVAEK